MKSDSFLLQLDGKHEDCRTKKTSFKIIIVFTKGVIEIEFWSVPAFSSFLPWSLSLSRHHTGVGPSKNPKIQQGWEERIFSLPPPPPRRISIEISFWFVYAFSDLDGMGVQGLYPPPPFLSENSTNKDYWVIANFIYLTTPFLRRNRCFDPPPPLPPPNAFYNNKKNLDLNNPFYRPFVFLRLLRPDFPNLPCLYSTFHLEYPSILSRFCFTIKITMLCILKNNSVHTYREPINRLYDWLWKSPLMLTEH